MAVNDRLSDVDQFVAGMLGVVAQHFECSIGIGGVARH